MCSLLEKYKPKTLADVCGHAAVIESLASFAQEPYAVAMLFHGESGVGKTATASALANDLGVLTAEGDFAGYHEIPSGAMGADEVKRKMRDLEFRPLLGSGWKVLVCNEADRMSCAAETIWLDVLEKLPPQTVVIFTTNAPEKLSRRFRDRCECYHFTCDAEDLGPHIQALAKKVWRKEVGKGEVPGLDTLGMPTLGDVDTMHASFRLALQQLTNLVRAARAGRAIDAEQAARNTLVSSTADADCPACGQALKVRTGAKTVKCPRCGARAKLQVA